MTELLHKLVTVPILLPIILLSIMVGCIVLALLMLPSILEIKA